MMAWYVRPSCSECPTFIRIARSSSWRSAIRCVLAVLPGSVSSCSFFWAIRSSYSALSAFSRRSFTVDSFFSSLHFAMSSATICMSRSTLASISWSDSAAAAAGSSPSLFCLFDFGPRSAAEDVHGRAGRRPDPRRAPPPPPRAPAPLVLGRPPQSWPLVRPGSVIVLAPPPLFIRSHVRAAPAPRREAGRPPEPPGVPSRPYPPGLPSTYPPTGRPPPPPPPGEVSPYATAAPEHVRPASALGRVRGELPAPAPYGGQTRRRLPPPPPPPPPETFPRPPAARAPWTRRAWTCPRASKHQQLGAGGEGGWGAGGSAGRAGRRAGGARGGARGARGRDAARRRAARRKGAGAMYMTM